MKPRQRRLLWVLAGLVLVAAAVTLVLRALNSNVMFFYSPSQVLAGEVPHGAAFRLGGLVEPARCSAAATGCCCASW
jgi:cytochrome c-type biogenesis protein CcmE